MRRYFKLCLSVTSSALALSPAYAQTAPSAPAEADIIVTAQKRSERLRDVPLSVTAISGDQLIARGITNPESLANAAPGLNLQKNDFGNPIFSIRGVGYFDQIVGASPTVSVYLDQVPIPFSAETAGAALDLERVEVLKGPQGTLFGNNSTGGAINFIANKPTSSPHAGINLDVGRFDTINAQAFLSGPLTSTLRARIAGRYEYSGPWQKSDPRLDNQFGAQTDRTLGRRRFATGRILLDWDPSDSLKFELNVNGWRDRSENQATQLVAFVPQANLNRFNDYIYRAFNTNPAFIAADTPPGNPAAAPLFTPVAGSANSSRLADWDPGKDYRRDNWFYQIALRGDYNLTDEIVLTSITAYAQFKQDMLLDTDGTPYVSSFVEPNARVTNFSQELRIAGGGQRLRWIIGGNYAYDRSSEVGRFSARNVTGNVFAIAGGYSGVALPILQIARNYAGFVSADYKLTDTLTLQGAVRYTQHDRKFEGCGQDPGDGSLARVISVAYGVSAGPGDCTTLVRPGLLRGLVRDELHENNLSWRGNISWKPSNDVLLYANVTKGYKTGGFSNVAGVFDFQYKPIPQESVVAVEAGAKFSMIDNHIQIDLAGFHMNYRNKQILGYINNVLFGALPQLVSVPKSRIYGAEANVTITPTRGLRLALAGTYVHSRVLEDPDTPLSPLNQVTSFVGESLPSTPTWQLNADADYKTRLTDKLDAFVGGGVIYRSSSQAAFGNVEQFILPAYTLLNLQTGIAAADGAWRFSIWGRNITNKFYVTNVQRRQDTVTRAVGMPATYGITMSYRY